MMARVFLIVICLVPMISSVFGEEGGTREDMFEVGGSTSSEKGGGEGVGGSTSSEKGGGEGESHEAHTSHEGGFQFVTDPDCTYDYTYLRPIWDGLRVTFDIKPEENPHTFDSLPRTEQKAVNNGWKMFTDCDCNSPFRGKRYALGDDHSVILLFDVNGYIAGIQTAFESSKLECPYIASQKQMGKMFQQDINDHVTMTIYFINPAYICTKGRSEEKFCAEGNGAELYIQHGIYPEIEYIKVPMFQSELDTDVWWKGKCIEGLGTHFWPRLSMEKSCDYFEPVFLLYTEGQLKGFGWALGMERQSTRFWNIDSSTFTRTKYPEFDCLFKYPTVATLHVFLTEDYAQNGCPNNTYT